MTNREKIFARLLLVLGLSTLIVLAAAALWDEMRKVRESIETVRGELPSLEARAAQLPFYRELAAKSIPEREKADPVDIYSVASSLAASCRKADVRVVGSTLSGTPPESILEMRIRGAIGSIIDLARESSDINGYSLLSLRIVTDENSRVGEAVLRVGHAH